MSFVITDQLHVLFIFFKLCNRNLGRRRQKEDEDEVMRMEVDENFGGKYMYIWNLMCV